MFRQTDRQTDGRTDGRTDGHEETRTDLLSRKTALKTDTSSETTLLCTENEEIWPRDMNGRNREIPRLLIAAVPCGPATTALQAAELELFFLQPAGRATRRP